MNKSSMMGFSAASLAAFAVLVMSAPALADPLAASSGATVDAGFPVITGPGTNVYTPTGSYLTDPEPNGGTTYGAVQAREVKANVINYSWPTSRTTKVFASGARVARAGSYSRTTVTTRKIGAGINQYYYY